MENARTTDSAATRMGLASILLWGTSIAVNRLVVVDIGLLRGPLLSAVISGVVGMIVLLARRGQWAKLARLPAAFWVVCGSLFVTYTLAYNLGVGLARTGRQLLLFGILNYLWPVLTVVFSAVIFRRRTRPWFAAGIVLAAAAVVLAFLSRPGAAVSGFSPSEVIRDLRDNPVVFLLGLYCGIAWALFSNLGRKIAGPSDADPVPLFFLAVGAALGAAWLLGADRLSPAFAGAAHWSFPGVSALAYNALLVSLVAYSFWDAAMRRGNQILVAAASLFTPLLSTAAIALVVGAAPGLLFWVACLVAIGGAALCRFSVNDQPLESRR